MINKSYISLRYWLLGKEMHQALKALEFASKFHTGTRKDGVTPEYFHQIEIANYLRIFCKYLSFTEETFTAALLHDVSEDYDVGFDEIFMNFDIKVTEAVQLLTKKYRNEKIPMDVYYTNIAKNPIASVVKGVDRISNLQTMTEVFSKEKQQIYVDETENLVLPMIKSARRSFTSQDSVYENIKYILNTQLKFIKKSL